jgi:hypothetical protein
MAPKHSKLATAQKKPASAAARTVLKKPASDAPSALLSETSLSLKDKLDDYNQRVEQGILDPSDAPNLTQDEWRQMWGKFKTARKGAPEAETMFTEIDDRKARDNKTQDKRRMMTAWIQDPKFGKKFWSITSSITSSHTLGRSKTWLTGHEMDEKFGGEATEMKRVAVSKRNPAKPKFWLYQVSTEYEDEHINKSKKATLAQTGDLKQEAFEKLQICMHFNKRNEVNANGHWAPLGPIRPVGPNVPKTDHVGPCGPSWPMRTHMGPCAI